MKMVTVCIYDVLSPGCRNGWKLCKQKSCDEDEIVTFPLKCIMKHETEEEKKFPEVKLQLQQQTKGMLIVYDSLC